MLTLSCFRLKCETLVKIVSRRFISPAFNQIGFRTKVTRAFHQPTCRLRLIRHDAFFLHNRIACPKFNIDPSPRHYSTGPKRPDLRSMTGYHTDDRLKSAEWTLIYHNLDYERYKNMVPPAVIVGCFSLIVLSLVINVVYQDIEKLNWEKGDWLFFGWPIGIGFTIVVLSRFRRRFVVRMYQQQSHLCPPGKRRYCIVWLNWFLRRTHFIYDHTETSDAVERRMANSVFGNFKAKKRWWHVKAQNFNNPQDYFNVRVNTLS